MTRKMKDSGIEWIGEIPEDWEVTKLKQLASFHNGDRGKNYPSGNDLVDEGVYFLTSNNIHGYYLDIDKSISKFITNERLNVLNGAKIQINDIVFCLRGSVGNCSINKSLEKGTIASSLMLIRPINIDADFLNYIMQSDIKVMEVLNLTTGSCAANLSAINVSNFKILQPSLSEQMKISNYLNKKTERIEDIKSTIVKQIQTLENYKKSVITEAVTKGLDKNVEMKDSGIEWIGEIPKHWKVNRLKFLVIDRQAGIWGKEVESEGDDRNIICIRVADFDFPRMTIRKDRAFTVRNYSNIDIIKYYLDKGDILVEKSGGGEKSPVGRTIIWEENFVAGYANFIERIRMDQNKICPMYAQYVFYAFYNMGISNLFFNQTTGIQNLDLSKMIRTLRFPVPSLNDQLNIINYLNKVIKILDETIEAKQKQLEVLEEYMKSLIYEYVTGKKEVKDGEES